MDPIRQAAALDILRSHNLQVRSESGRWRAYGERGAAITATDYDDPVVALEAAGEAILQASVSEQERRVRKLFQALSAAKYMPWPRVKADGTVEWLVLRVSDRQPIGQPREGLLAALIDVAKIVEVESRASSR